MPAAVTHDPEFPVPNKPTQICFSFMSQCKPGVLGQAAFHMPFSDSGSFVLWLYPCPGLRSPLHSAGVWEGAHGAVITSVYPPWPRSGTFHWLTSTLVLPRVWRGSGKCGGCLEMHFPAPYLRCGKGAGISGGQLAIFASASLRI